MIKMHPFLNIVILIAACVAPVEFTFLISLWYLPVLLYICFLAGGNISDFRDYRSPLFVKGKEHKEGNGTWFAFIVTSVLALGSQFWIHLDK